MHSLRMQNKVNRCAALAAIDNTPVRPFDTRVTGSIEPAQPWPDRVISFLIARFVMASLSYSKGPRCGVIWGALCALLTKTTIQHPPNRGPVFSKGMGRAFSPSHSHPKPFPLAAYDTQRMTGCFIQPPCIHRPSTTSPPQACQRRTPVEGGTPPRVLPPHPFRPPSRSR
jgi:hypothetical protein